MVKINRRSSVGTKLRHGIHYDSTQEVQQPGVQVDGVPTTPLTLVEDSRPALGYGHNKDSKSYYCNDDDPKTKLVTRIVDDCTGNINSQSAIYQRGVSMQVITDNGSHPINNAKISLARSLRLVADEIEAKMRAELTNGGQVDYTVLYRGLLPNAISDLPKSSKTCSNIQNRFEIYLHDEIFETPDASIAEINTALMRINLNLNQDKEDAKDFFDKVFEDYQDLIAVHITAIDACINFQKIKPKEGDLEDHITKGCKMTLGMYLLYFCNGCKTNTVAYPYRASRLMMRCQQQ